MEKKEMLNKIRCTNCSSSQTYVKFSTGERKCRICGFIKKLDKE